LGTLIGSTCLSTITGTTTTIPAGDDTSWNQHTVNTGAGLRPVFTAVADFDADSKLDVIAAYTGQNTTNPAVIIFFQDSIDSFTAVTIGTGTDLASVSSLAVADLDEDGHLDVVAACDGQLVYFHSASDARTAAGWTRSIIDGSTGTGIGVWQDVVIGSIDGINGLDIVACNPNVARWSWFKSPVVGIITGSGWARFDIDTASKAGAAGVAIADFDFDGRLDVISTSQDGNIDPRIAWYRNPADPTVVDDWTKFKVGNLPSASRVIVADLDSDGRSDVVALNASGKQIGWYRQPSDATTAWSGFLLAQFTSATPVDLKAADVEGNGQLNVIVAASSGPLLRWFSPTSSDQTLQWTENKVRDLDTSFTPFRIAIGDIDADGRPDAIVPVQATSSAQDAILWLENPK
jgi:hypothetical protein